MPAKLTTTVSNMDTKVKNQVNRDLIKEFYIYLKNLDTSDNYQNGLLKVIIRYAEYLGPNTIFYQIQDKEQIIKYLESKRKTVEEDQDKKWIITWNDYLWRLKYFYRWLYNTKEKGLNAKSYDSWTTLSFINIKSKRTKRLSLYSETEIWDKDELFTIIKYETNIRNKAILSLMWDLDARPSEIVLLKNKHIRLKEKYGEGEIPHQAKTGSGPVLLTFSFPYVRDWLNLHPFKGQQEDRLICNLQTGAPIKADQINEIMKQLKERIKIILERCEIMNTKEKEKLEYLLSTKKWNPYCIRHSAITSDSDYLPEYALKKKVRWSMNSKQGSRYIKNRMGNELKNKILAYNGIISENETIKKPSISSCPRCEFVNVIENKYCSKCSYPLKPEAYEEIKQIEEDRIKKLEEKYNQGMISLREEMENKFQELFQKIDIQKL